MNDVANGPESDLAGSADLPEEAVMADEDAAPVPQTEPEPETEAEPEPEPEPAVELDPKPEAVPLTLDELVADLAESEAVEEPAALAPTADEAVVEEPEHETPAAEEAVEETAGPKPLLRRWWTQVPFWVVDAVWVVLTVGAVVSLWRAPAATLTDGIAYTVLVLGGAALAFIGLVTGLVVWLVARSRAGEDERGGLGLTIWTRALAWTAGGVALWWIGLLVLDLHHAGVIG
jgi:hypothetical protein